MLTGDHPGTATAIAGELGLAEWRAQVLPEDKQAVVQALQAERRREQLPASPATGSASCPRLPPGIRTGLRAGPAAADLRRGWPARVTR
jgi:manganese-transporting P-type ATPase C